MAGPRPCTALSEPRRPAASGWKTGLSSLCRPGPGTPSSGFTRRAYAEHRRRDRLVLSSACRSQVALTMKRRVEKVTPLWKVKSQRADAGAGGSLWARVPR